jgi:hypothetical protein
MQLPAECKDWQEAWRRGVVDRDHSAAIREDVERAHRLALIEDVERTACSASRRAEVDA